MSNWALACTLVFVVVTILLSVQRKLGLEKEIAIGTVRAAVQLLLIGYVLHYVFDTRKPALIVLIVLLMITVASFNAGKRADRIPGIRLRIGLTLLVTESITMGLLLLLHIIEATPQYIIPVSGIIVGSSMIVSGLFLSQMNRELEAARGEIETLLTLGATPRQAIGHSVKRAIRSSMIPTFDGMKTVGLVQLPGMMTGMIVAGAEPIEAVRYQILIMFVLSSSAAVTAIMLGGISAKLWFTKEGLLRKG
ncbi:putative ABC transport system permease protein [Paenibacillus phyllosphaerae]|uniref:Putative ABC transport system permease protein n=1 Tax=Paenibacillus phyllosphaerae TaxID=274593 RepID=A0A7W5ATQ8_9BACL|nr:iron export ABC transporter permease subunit FetB [Paenibacillus phyllosphaerae]MBB3108619.1 putative ABC transport system permease protein [Paenibacillus phyllosphaerae]